MTKLLDQIQIDILKQELDLTRKNVLKEVARNMKKANLSLVKIKQVIPLPDDELEALYYYDPQANHPKRPL